MCNKAFKCMNMYNTYLKVYTKMYKNNINDQSNIKKNLDLSLSNGIKKCSSSFYLPNKFMAALTNGKYQPIVLNEYQPLTIASDDSILAGCGKILFSIPLTNYNAIHLDAFPFSRQENDYQIIENRFQGTSKSKRNIFLGNYTKLKPSNDLSNDRIDAVGNHINHAHGSLQESKKSHSLTSQEEYFLDLVNDEEINIVTFESIKHRAKAGYGMNLNRNVAITIL